MELFVEVYSLINIESDSVMAGWRRNADIISMLRI